MNETRARRLGDYLQNECGWIIWEKYDVRCSKDRAHQVSDEDNFCRVCGTKLECQHESDQEAELERALQYALGETK